MAQIYPKGHINRAMPTWSEEDFQRRVEARIAQLGVTETRLLRGKGFTGDEIRTVAKQGRRIDTIAKIATALQWTLGQAIGIHDPTLFLDREREIDPTKLARSLSIAEDAVGDYTAEDRLTLVADAASLVYSVLAEREAAGRPLSDDESAAVIESLLRRFFAK